MAVAIRHSLFCIVDGNGVPISGAKFNIYAATTTTPLTVYSDSSLSTTADNPIVTDSSGVLPLRYIATASYKITATTAAGAALTRYSGDNIDPGVAVGSGALAVADGGTGATSAGPARANLGAASSASLTTVTSDVTTLQGYHTGTSNMPLASGTTAQRPGSPSNGQWRFNSTTGTPEMYVNGTWHYVGLAPAVAGSFKNLLVKNGTTQDEQIDITADELVVKTTDNVAIRLTDVSVTANNTASGANGIDASSVAVSTWYSIWVIFNPTTGTTASLLSTSATTPTMPSGYTYKARVGWQRTDSTSDFLRIRQTGRRARYLTSDAVYPIIVPATSTGTASVGNYTGFSVANFVPSTALTIAWSLTGNNTSAMFAPANTFAGPSSLTNPPPAAINTANTGGVVGEYTLEGTYPQNVYAVLTNNGAIVQTMGWEDNI